MAARRGRAPLLAAATGALAVIIAVAATALARGHHDSAPEAAVTSVSVASSIVAPPVAAAAGRTALVSRASSDTPVERTTTPTRPAETPADKQLPLNFSTGDATQVLTVLASSTSSTTGSVQAWQHTAGGWIRHGTALPAELGSDGLSEHPSESVSATPIGSFTLTQAFGADANPGTALPYLVTTPADWWISQPGPLYNTHQRCASDCPFTQGAPNEHLRFETPSYNYAVVIDYNTPNAGPVVQGAGSAFFLHVSTGVPTAGCVSIPQTNLVQIMRWLTPADHPRILIGLQR